MPAERDNGRERELLARQRAHEHEHGVPGAPAVREWTARNGHSTHDLGVRHAERAAETSSGRRVRDGPWWPCRRRVDLPLEVSLRHGHYQRTRRLLLRW